MTTPRPNPLRQALAALEIEQARRAVSRAIESTFDAHERALFTTVRLQTGERVLPGRV